MHPEGTQRGNRGASKRVMEEAGDALAMKEKVKELENKLAGMAELRQQLAQMQRMLMTKNSQVKSVMNSSRNVMINHA